MRRGDARGQSEDRSDHGDPKLARRLHPVIPTRRGRPMEHRITVSARTRHSPTTLASIVATDSVSMDPAAPSAHLDIGSVAPLLTTAIQRNHHDHWPTCAHPCK
jgi:hypothetical protein